MRRGEGRGGQRSPCLPARGLLFLFVLFFSDDAHGSAECFVADAQGVAFPVESVALQGCGGAAGLEGDGLEGGVGEGDVALGEQQGGFLPDLEGSLSLGEGLGVAVAQKSYAVEGCLPVALLVELLYLLEHARGVLVGVGAGGEGAGGEEEGDY